jgi:hypothetical protein
MVIDMTICNWKQSYCLSAQLNEFQQDHNTYLSIQHESVVSCNMDIHKQPALVPSVTEDDDEMGHERLVDEVRANRGTNRDALAYLLRYETMVRQQEAEDMATLAHIRPCVERLEALAGIKAVSSSSRKTRAEADSALLAREISFASLKKALEALDEECDYSSEFMSTDRQLMMVLRLLTQKTGTDGDEQDDDVFIAWVEFFQAYKVCIAGMLTLQHLPPTSAIRNRARDRTLAMLSLFEAPSTQLFRTEDSGYVDSAPLTRELNRPGAAIFAPAGTPKRKRRRRYLGFALVAALMALFGILLTTNKSPRTTVFETETTPRVKSSSQLQDDYNTPTYSSVSPTRRDTFQPRMIQVTHPIAAMATAPAVKSLPQADMATRPHAAQSVPIHNISNLSGQTLVGGVVGLLTAPLVFPAVQAQLVVSSLTVVHLASAAVLCAGLVSVAIIVVRGLVGIWRHVTKKAH